jgi:hypothetical protein
MTSDVRSPTPPPPPSCPGNAQTQTPVVSAPVRPRSLMETLLVAKMEKAGACLTSSPPSPLPPAILLRTDSADSASSLSSTSSDVCRCDDCLLGIADLYVTSPEDEARGRKKVGQLSVLAPSTFHAWVSKRTFWWRRKSFKNSVRTSKKTHHHLVSQWTLLNIVLFLINTDNHMTPRSWSCSVSIVSDYRLDDRSSIPGRGKGFLL